MCLFTVPARQGSHLTQVPVGLEVAEAGGLWGGLEGG